MSVKTCQTIPAIMRLFPTDCRLEPFPAVAARPPPAPWRTKERKSQRMNIQVYKRGFRREKEEPISRTMCFKVR